VMKSEDIAKKACWILDDKKGSDIVIFDVQKVSGVTDYFVVVSGTSPPHLKALFNELQHSLKQEGVPCFRRAGDPESGWLVLDYIDVVIHVFSPEARQYYAIEELWEEAPKLDWKT